MPEKIMFSFVNVPLDVCLSEPITNNFKSLEVEPGSNDLLLFIEVPISLYLPWISSCRSMLRQLGNPLVRHLQWYKVAYFLCKIGCQLTMTPQSFLLLLPLTVANYLLKADKEGVLYSKLTSSFTYNKLAPLGNLSVITSTNSDHVRLIDPCLPK